MNVKELIEYLETFPQDLEVITTCCSDYQFMDKEDIKVIKAVPKDFYIMRSHRTMNKENKDKEQTFLHFSGN